MRRFYEEVEAPIPMVESVRTHQTRRQYLEEQHRREMQRRMNALFSDEISLGKKEIVYGVLGELDPAIEEVHLNL